jgi:hypothetical protein
VLRSLPFTSSVKSLIMTGLEEKAAPLEASHIEMEKTMSTNEKEQIVASSDTSVVEDEEDVRLNWKQIAAILVSGFNALLHRLCF